MYLLQVPETSLILFFVLEKGYRRSERHSELKIHALRDSITVHAPSQQCLLVVCEQIKVVDV